MRKTLMGVASTTAALGVGLFGLAAPAQAVGKNVGTCVKTNVYTQPADQVAQVINRCKGSVKVKVVAAFHKDSPCVTLPKGAKPYHFRIKAPGYYKKTVKC
ncbi:hypothetical protein [Streptomyces sp. CC228A]|uniref:hypothetical protein n=1 Tax=Streptomyces sp. CC228A TaxID=2898186 RepID=UPI001F3A396E|nr:hypothetical protein [Streptomyces sp. CC228A]